VKRSKAIQAVREEIQRDPGQSEGSKEIQALREEFQRNQAMREEIQRDPGLA